MRLANCQLLACRGVVDTLPLVGVDNGRRASLPPAIASRYRGWGANRQRLSQACRAPINNSLTNSGGLWIFRGQQRGAHRPAMVVFVSGNLTSILIAVRFAIADW